MPLAGYTVACADVAAHVMDLLQELTRLQKLVQLPPIAEALKDKYSRFDDDLNPTHDHQGNELEPKVSLHWQLTSHLPEVASPLAHHQADFSAFGTLLESC